MGLERNIQKQERHSALGYWFRPGAGKLQNKSK